MLESGNIYKAKCLKEYMEGSIPLNIEGCAFVTLEGHVRFIARRYSALFNSAEESMEYLKFEKDSYYASVGENGIDVEDTFFDKPSHLTAGSEVQVVEYLNAPTELKPLLDLERTFQITDERHLTTLVERLYT